MSYTAFPLHYMNHWKQGRNISTYNITIANFKIDRTNNNIKHNFLVHWHPRTIMTPSLAPFQAQNVVITTISDANRGDKVDIMTTSSYTCFKLWLRSNEWQPHLLCCRPQGDVVIVLSIPTVTEWTLIEPDFGTKWHEDCLVIHSG